MPNCHICQNALPNSQVASCPVCQADLSQPQLETVARSDRCRYSMPAMPRTSAIAVLTNKRILLLPHSNPTQKNKKPAVWYPWENLKRIEYLYKKPFLFLLTDGGEYCCVDLGEQRSNWNPHLPAHLTFDLDDCRLCETRLNDPTLDHCHFCGANLCDPNAERKLISSRCLFEIEDGITRKGLAVLTDKRILVVVDKGTSIKGRVGATFLFGPIGSAIYELITSKPSKKPFSFPLKEVKQCRYSCGKMQFRAEKKLHTITLEKGAPSWDDFFPAGLIKT